MVLLYRPDKGFTYKCGLCLFEEYRLLQAHKEPLSPASQTILLSGPAAELYQQMLAKLLLLHVNDFSLKVQSKYGASSKENMGSESFLNPPNLPRNASSSANIDELASKCTPPNPAPLRRTSSLSFDENLFVQTLYKVLTFISNNSPIVLYLRDVEKLLCRSQRVYTLFQKYWSQVVDSEKDYRQVDERITSVFPYIIEIKPPQEENYLVSWKSQLEQDMRMIKIQDNRDHISEVLAANDLDIDDLASICVADTIDLSHYIEEIVVSAISYNLTHTKNPEYRNGKLVISSARSDLLYTNVCSLKVNTRLSVFGYQQFVSRVESVPGSNPKPETKAESTRASEAEASAPKTGDNVTPAAAPKAPEVPADNEFEKRIRPEVIPASEIGVTFADIGALDDIKDSLQELVMLPLRRPDLDNNACKGHRQRSRAGEHEAMRKIKHEFMTHWDGLLTKPGERILVLAATNQPFDLDEAIIRRFERRIMVGLPSVEYRGKILQTLLSKEHIEEGLNFSELATMTEGYTGSDLKEKKRIAESGEGPQSPEEAIEEKVITIRPLKMEDFREAKNQVAASFASGGSIMGELKQWNEQYGEGGSRKKEQLSYFL
ncbi:AAA+ ATPase domain-containing protein [Tanacetum coccineum]